MGTSGQNIHDIRQFANLAAKDLPEAELTLDIMQQTLEMRHICPTAPDTLRAFPYVDSDPFVVHQAPHVYFAGNQEAYGERLVTSTVTTCKQAVKILSLPIFRKTKSIVLLDVTSLQSYEIKFDVSNGIMPTRDSAMEMDQA